MDASSTQPHSAPAVPQCMLALDYANRIRIARAALKRSIAAGERDVAEVVFDCPQETETMAIGELLRSQRRWGRTRTRRFLAAISIAENKALVTLTPRQRILVVDALRDRRSEPRDPVAPMLRAA